MQRSAIGAPCVHPRRLLLATRFVLPRQQRARALPDSKDGVNTGRTQVNPPVPPTSTRLQPHTTQPQIDHNPAQPTTKSPTATPTSIVS
eukprot:2350016-Rhodomonas_salina.2